MGIGVATGNAVAGKIGTSHQVKVTAFGPVVNLAARLEGMTGQMKIPILIDGATAAAASEFLHNKNIAGVRKLGKFRPFGLYVPCEIHQLHPLEMTAETRVIQAYQQAFENFETGNWEAASTLLRDISAIDPAAAFLEAYIQSEGTPADDFDGTMVLAAK